jgi:hypothetical protein
MAALTQATASFVADETVSALVFDEFIQQPAMMPMFYNQKPSSTYREQAGSFSALGDFAPKTSLQAPTQDNPIQQYKKEFLHQEFALMSEVERKVIDDSQFEFFGQFGAKIGQSAARTFEKYAAYQFNQSFSSTLYLAEDGLTLCSAAHVNVDAGNSQSNTGTTALTPAAAATTRAAMRNWTDYRGNTIFVNPDLLLGPNGLEKTIWEIVNSSYAPGSTNPTDNFFKGQLQGVIWDYLTTSTTAWWMIDSRAMKQNLFWYWRVPLEIYGDGDLFVGSKRIGGYYRSSHGVSDWRWIFGQNA